MVNNKNVKIADNNSKNNDLRLRLSFNNHQILNNNR